VTTPSERIARLSELEPEEIADCYALLAEKDRAKTRDGKPYYRVTFRDSARSATAMVWSDSAWFGDCDTVWKAGEFYKLRCRYSETQYGPQIELDRIRPVEESDRGSGFDPAEFCASTRFDRGEMFTELLEIAEREISIVPLRQLVIGLFEEHRETIRRLPAASKNHHAFAGGFLEHVLSVTRSAVYLADKYADYYPRMQPPLSKSLVVAGAILHDIGKVVELSVQPQGASYTAEGQLIGHILLGRDLVRDKAAQMAHADARSEVDREILLRLEHIIVSHQNLPEWGSPIAPHTPEALLVYFADDVDAKFHMMAFALEEEPQDEEQFTSRSNALRRSIFRGLNKRLEGEG